MVREPFDCPVDDMCDCTTGVCERAPKRDWRCDTCRRLAEAMSPEPANLCQTRCVVADLDFTLSPPEPRYMETLDAEERQD